MSLDPELPTDFLLSNGFRIPALGLGTFEADLRYGHLKDVVLAALKEGYRHFDTATSYGNEKEIGDALKESGIARQDIFITTKLDQNWHEPASVAKALDESLARLQLDYVDLFLLHFPHAYLTNEDHSKRRHPDGKPMIDYDLSRSYTEVWAAMESLVDSGKAKSIGISNFNILKTKRILQAARMKPVVNQIELHPYLPQHDLLRFCKQEGIHAVAHQPLGGKPIDAVNPLAAQPGPLSNPKIASIASEYGKSPAQTLLSWNVMRGVSVIPKTATVARLAENRRLFRLGAAHFDQICALSAETGTFRYLDPRVYIGFDIFDETADQPV